MMKLRSIEYYNKIRDAQYSWKVCYAWCFCFYEIFVTQLNLLNLFTDFAFLAITYRPSYKGDENYELQRFFGLSVTMFILQSIPKFISLCILLWIMCTGNLKIQVDPLTNQSNINSSVFDDDKRRKFVQRAFVFSEFRTPAVCVNFVNYDTRKYDLIAATIKFWTQDFPQFVIQICFLRYTNCGSKTNGVMVHVSIYVSLLCMFFNFCMRLILFVHAWKDAQSYTYCIDLKLGNKQIASLSTKVIQEKLAYNADLQSVRLAGHKTEYYYLNEKRLDKLKAMLKALPNQSRM